MSATYCENDISEDRIIEFRLKASKYAVMIPVLNEGETILAQLERMREAQCPADIILSDGDSQDGSMEHNRLIALGVRCLLATRKPGLGIALQRGLNYALEQGYQGVITIDGNGKDGVESIPSFVDALNEGYDFVQGSRFAVGGKCENTPIDRYLGIRLFISPLMSLASGFRFTDPTNGFKGLSRALLSDHRMDLMRDDLSGFNFQFYLNYRAPRLGFKVVEIPVSRSYPKHGPTPTKIVGLRHRIKLVKQFLLAISGHYNPPRHKQ